jgi:hypothetical protein
MELIHTISYDTKSPIAHFITADFKPKTAFYKNIDNLYDIRRRLKLHYRYYGDIFNFNSRKRDCLRLFTNDIKLYNLIIAENKLDEATKESIRMALCLLREQLVKDGFKAFSICSENINLIINNEEFDDVITDIFGNDEINISVFNTNVKIND